MLARSCISVSTIRLKCGGRFWGPIGGPPSGSIIRPQFRFHRNDNEQSRYHCDETGIGASKWTLNRTPPGWASKRLKREEFIAMASGVLMTTKLHGDARRAHL